MSGTTGLVVEAQVQLGDLGLDLKLAVESGSPIALVGPSGAGKSSVLRIIAGLLHPERGTVSCGGSDWLDTDRGVDVAPERRACGYLFQDYALFPRMTALANVAYPLHATPRAERHRRALSLLQRFGLEGRADARPRTLSGGERQRVALARALARDPRVLLLDEPLSALDSRSRAAATRELRAVIGELGVPVLVVTHDFTEAAQLADRIAVIESGCLVQAGSASELAARPQSAFVADLAGANVLRGTARASRGSTTIALEGGGEIASTDAGEGPVTATVFPWEISVDLQPAESTGSQLNHLPAVVESVVAVGGRVRVGLLADQPLVAEISPNSVERLAIAPGLRVMASWKATATRIVADAPST